MELKICVTAPASPRVAGWLNNFAGAAVRACRFRDYPFGIELRSMRFLGFARRDEKELVFLSSRAQFWSKAGVVSTVLHEYAHQLVFEFERDQKIDTDGHGPLFFLVLLTLCRRVEKAGILVGQLVNACNLYDFQDSNHADLKGNGDSFQKSLVLRWALNEFDRLACGHWCAEDLPLEAHKRWVEHMSLRAQAEFEVLQRNQKINSLAQEVAELRAELMVLRPPQKPISVRLANWALGLTVLALWVAVTQR